MTRCLTSYSIRQYAVHFTHFQTQSIRLLSTCSLVKHELKLNVTSNNCVKLLSPNTLQAEFTRSSGTSFFTKTSAEQLWSSVTGVSNAGKKRGRGKGTGRKIPKDLNKGQVIGVGADNIIWPGLNAPVIRGKEVVQRIQLPPDPERQDKLIKLRDQLGRFRPLKMGPLERGWSGAKMHGRKIGPPDDIGQDKFEGFDTVILEMKSVASMDGNIGKVRRFSCVCFTGNKNGLGGIGLAKSPEGRATIKRAKNRAGQKLLYYPRYNDHTIMHNFYTRFGQTKIFVTKKHEGFGLVCHRAIKSICELIGIKDLHAKIEGPTNVQHIMKAFLLGLLRQKSHQELAQMKGLFLVEQREDTFNFPLVIGVPDKCRTEDEILENETLDFTQFAMDDKVALKKKKYPPFFVGSYGWQLHLLKTERFRNQYNTRVQLLAEYSGRSLPRSHLSEKYPECYARYSLLLHQKQRREREAAEAAADE